MRVSRAWLESMVSSGWDAMQLSHRLTMAGFEVEGQSAAAGAFDQVVIGRVVKCEPHPAADRLKVTEVDIGSAQLLQIVCGASNVRAGLTVPVACVGATLPGDVHIKRAKLRGVESNGMLCSARELGLGEDAEGLLELPSELPLGRNFREALELDDIIFELNFTPNRGDALSTLGLAREVAVLCGQPLRMPELSVVAVSHDQRVAVTLSAPGAGRFLGRVITGLNPQAITPLWMKERLRRAGLRSLGPLVDVTNYVMLELGQPMHAYDRRRLSGAINVRLAKADEPLTLLDGTTLQLKSDVMVIADDAGAVGLAGIMGGEKSGIAADTTEVFLEVAWFAPSAIAGRARRHGLLTDASQRFERGVDPAGLERAMQRATGLLLQLAGGQAGPVVSADAPSQWPVRNPILLREKSIKQLIGIEIEAERVQKILLDLGMGVAPVSGGWQVESPSWRFDIALEADLIEELARVYGYNQIPEIDALTPTLPYLPSEHRVSDERLASLLVDRGYFEAINYTFVDPALQSVLFADASTLALANPLSSELAVMRVSLWSGLVKNLKANSRRQADRVRLFEIGSRFVMNLGQLQEIHTVAGLAWGRSFSEQWGLKAQGVDFYDVKADVEALLALSGQPAVTFAAANLPTLHPGRTAQISVNGEAAGFIGELHPKVAAELDLDGAVYLFELDVEKINIAQIPVSKDISRFPYIRRDIAVVVNEATTFNELQHSVTVAASGLLRELKVFDVYRGKGIETGKKSVALGLILQENSRTLTDAEADSVVQRVTTALNADLQAVLRD